MTERNVKSLHEQWKEFKTPEETYGGGKEFSEIPSAANAYITPYSNTLKLFYVDDKGKAYRLSQDDKKVFLEVNPIQGKGSRDGDNYSMDTNDQIGLKVLEDLAENYLKCVGCFSNDVILTPDYYIATEKKILFETTSFSGSTKTFIVNYTLPRGYTYKATAEKVDIAGGGTEDASYFYWEYSYEDSEDWFPIPGSTKGVEKDSAGNNSAIAYIQSSNILSKRPRIRLFFYLDKVGQNDYLKKATIKIEPIFNTETSF